MDETNIFFFAILAVILMAAIVIFSFYIKFSKMQTALMSRQMHLKRLREKCYEQSIQFIDDNCKKIEKLQALLQEHLQKEDELKSVIERLQYKNRIAEIDISLKEKAAKNIVTSDIYNTIKHQLLVDNGNILTDEMWKELDLKINEVYDGFTSRLFEYVKLNSHEYKLSLLIKIGLSPLEISTLTAHSKQSVTNTRKRLYKKAFGIDGTGKDWDDFILSL